MRIYLHEKKKLQPKKGISLFIVISFICCGIFICGGCGGPVKAYTGSAKPDNETVLLKCDYWSLLGDSQGAAIRKIWDVNDKMIWEGNARTLRMLPGTYNLETCYCAKSFGYAANGAIAGAVTGAAEGTANQIAHDKTASTLKATLLKGKEYMVKYKKTGLFVWEWKASFWIEDLQSGEVISGTKLEK
jgi:hypothetical protein